MGAWVCVVQPRGHFPPFWLPPRARRISSTVSSHHVGLRTMRSTLVPVQSWSAMYSFPCPSDDAAVSQRAWDTPAVARDWLSVWQSASTDTDKARLTAIRAQHSSDWLFALPISACGLRLGDEAIRVAVGLRLGPILMRGVYIVLLVSAAPEGQLAISS